MAEVCCPRCALPLKDTLSELCASCLKSEPPFSCCLAAYVYDFPVDRLIRNIKYSHRLELVAPLVTPLVEVLTDHYQQQWPDRMIPVPLHPKKLRQRGYNQALLIAKAIAKQLPEGIHCPVDYRMVKRHRHTDAQQGLSVKGRRKNIKGAFVTEQALYSQHPQQYRHVALVDDVVTTGETAKEVSRVLQKQGVEQVDVWCLARTPAAPFNFV